MLDKSNKRSVLMNYTYSIGLNFFKLAAPIIVIPYVYRQIAPFEMGKINLAIAIMTYFYIAGDFGQYIYGIREVSMIKKDPQKVNIFFTEMFRLGLITNLTCATLFFFYIEFFASVQINHIYYYIAGIQIIATIFNVEWMFEATENYKYIAIKTIIVRIITIACTFIFVRGDHAPEFYILFLSLFILLNNLSSFIYIQRHIIWYKGKLFLKRHIKNMFFICVMINWALLYFQLDKLILGHNGQIVGVSFYTISERVVTLGSSFLFSFIMVVTPRLGSKINNDSSSYNMLLQKILNIIFLFVFPLCFFLFASSYEIVDILGGKGYIGATSVLMIFVFYIIFYIFMECLKTNIMLLFKKERVYFLAILTGGLVNLIIKLLFGKYFSPSNVILITMIIVMLVFSAMLVYCKVKLSVNFLNKNTLLYLVLSAPILMLISFRMDSVILSLIIKASSVVIYYVGMLFILKDKQFYFIKNSLLNRLGFGLK